MTQDQMSAWMLWLRAAAIRVIRVGAAAGVAVMAGQTIWAEIRWSVIFGTIILAMIVETLVCIASLPEAPFPADLWGGEYGEVEEPDTFDDLKDKDEEGG